MAADEGVFVGWEWPRARGTSVGTLEERTPTVMCGRDVHGCACSWDVNACSPLKIVGTLARKPKTAVRPVHIRWCAVGDDANVIQD